MYCLSAVGVFWGAAVLASTTAFPRSASSRAPSRMARRSMANIRMHRIVQSTRLISVPISA